MHGQRRRLSRLIGPVLATSVFLVAASSASASACSIAEYPTVREIREGARAIFLGRAVARDEVDGAPDRWAFTVDRVLKGDVGDEVTGARLETTTCLDDLHADIGQTVVVALGVPLFGKRIDPVWVFRDNGRLQYSTAGGEAKSIETVVASLLGDPPPTDTVAQATDHEREWGLTMLFFGLLVLGVVVTSRGQGAARRTTQ